MSSKRPSLTLFLSQLRNTIEEASIHELITKPIEWSEQFWKEEDEEFYDQREDQKERAQDEQ